jgi:hypothetical protein
MKKLLVLMMHLAFITTSYSQQPEVPTSLTMADYLKKSKNQKKAAWILTGVGTTGLLTTVIAVAGQAVGDVLTRASSNGTVDPEYRSLTVPYLLSLASVAGGITLFIASAKNRRNAEAALAYIKLDNTLVLQQSGIVKYSYPAIAVRLAL